MIEHYSHKIQNAIQKELFKANKSIKIAVAWFTNDLLFQPLLLKLSAGVTVEIVLNKDEINCSDENEFDFDAFVNAGGIIRWNTSKQLMHNKFCIFDKEALITGSYNWTYSAELRNAENIIFQNSFNLYVSAREALDTLVDISQAKNDWTANERPKRIMPDRPKEAGNTDVQTRFYRERASALSFTAEAKDCVLKNCRVVGRQDAFYGDHGASVAVEGGILAGAVDYIFGGLTLYVVGAELVGMISGENNDGCYITAGRAATPENLATLPQASRDSVPRDEIVEKGMLLVDCTVRHATQDELKNPGTRPILLGRPWRWWGETVFVGVQAEPGVLDEKLWSLGLTKGHPAPFVKAINN